MVIFAELSNIPYSFWGSFFFDFLNLLSFMISGTALQERAYAIASKDETIRALFINLSVENSLEGRDEIYVVAQKTVTTV